MKKLTISILSLLALTLAGCERPEKGLESTSGLFQEDITTTVYFRAALGGV